MFNKLAKLFKKKEDLNCSHRNLTPTEDIAVAESEFKEGNLRHAAYHVGCALVTDANQTDWLKLLDRICDIADDPLQLAPLQENNYVGTMAVRAYILHRLRRTSEALQILMQVVLARPQADYLQWAIDWLRQPELAGKIDLEPLYIYLGQTGDKLQQMAANPDVKRATLDRIPALLQAAYETQHPETQAIFMFAVILKRLGYLDELAVLAQDAFERQPDYNTANAMASSYRVRGDVDNAIRMYREAIKHDPDDLAVRHDIGDLELERSRYPEAVAAYTEILEREPNGPWALPSFYAAQFLLTGDDDWAQKLNDYTAQMPQNQRAKQMQMLTQMPYFGSVLPEPSEAVINVAKQICEQLAGVADPPASADLGLSSLEAPSAIASVGDELRLVLRPDFQLNLAVDIQKRPDPREPRISVTHRLWTYDGIKARPSIPPPSSSVSEVIARIAASPYNDTKWIQDARIAASQIGPRQAGDLLGAMVYPSAKPTEFRAWDWWYRTQFAAAFVISQLDSGWAGSQRRSLLLSIANGPMDWSVSAAVVALSLVATECPQSQAEVKQLFLDLIDYSDRLNGYVCFRLPVLISALRLPNLDTGEKERLNKLLAQELQDG